MPYTPNTPWQDFPSTATPISAARLQNMEERITASASVVAQTTTTNTAAQNSTEIQAAITAAVAANGDVLLPGGTYDHEGFTLPVAGKIAIRGRGRGVTILRNTHATNPSIRANGTTGGPYQPNWTLSDLTITTNAVRTGQVGLHLLLTSRFTVRDIEIISHDTGVRHEASWDCTLDTINVHDCTTGWFFPTTAFTPSAPVTITNGSAWSCGTAVYIANGIEAIDWQGGDFAGSGYGVLLRGNQTRALRFAGINFERITNDDIEIGDATTGPTAIRFESCRFLRTTTGTRSVHYLRGTGVSLASCWWSNYTTAILHTGTAGDLSYSGCSTASVTTFLSDPSGTARPVVAPTPGAMVRMYASSTAQTIANFALDLIDMNATEAIDANYTVDLTTNRITVLATGKYMASWELKVTGGGAGQRYASIYKNGATLLRETGLRVSGGTNTDATSGSSSIRLVKNDTMELRGYVDGGSAVTVVSANSYETGLALAFLGP